MDHLFTSIAILTLTLWVLVWKGYALWTASRRNERAWFIVLLVVNTVSILDIFYIFQVAKKTRKEVWGALNRTIFSVGEFKKRKKRADTSETTI